MKKSDRTDKLSKTSTVNGNGVNTNSWFVMRAFKRLSSEKKGCALGTKMYANYLNYIYLAKFAN